MTRTSWRLGRHLDHRSPPLIDGRVDMSGPQRPLWQRPEAAGLALRRDVLPSWAASMSLPGGDGTIRRHWRRSASAATIRPTIACVGQGQQHEHPGLDADLRRFTGTGERRQQAATAATWSIDSLGGPGGVGRPIAWVQWEETMFSGNPGSSSGTTTP